jgi:WhiB family redox-sensing transcriptional regulator
VSWGSRALCAARGIHENLFYPEPGSRRTAGLTLLEARAKRICAKCPVRRECLAFGLEVNDAKGMWWEPPEGDGFYIRPIAMGIYGGQTARERSARELSQLPIEARLDLLEARFKLQMPRFLTKGELTECLTSPASP